MSDYFLLLCLYSVTASDGKDEEEDDEGSDDDDDLADADEEESDLDLAWKMLDVARAIAEKHPGDTMDKVDILSALAEVALERGLFMHLFEFKFATVRMFLVLF